MSLTCKGCGRIVETLPTQCGYSISFNSETNQWECCLENCGIISFNDFLCESCCKNRKMMTINKSIERLSIENEEFNDELSVIKKNTVQTNLDDSDFSYWVTFGQGEYNYGRGKIEGANIRVTCPQDTMNQILSGDTDVFSEFFAGRLKIEGNLQYAIVYFELINLALEINSERGGV